MPLSLQLSQLIDLYFAGLTTLEQEQRLRRLLATTTEQSPLIDEARAVISFAAMPAGAKTAARSNIFGPFMQRVAAASIVVAALAGGITYISNHTSELSTTSQCYAMVEGTVINDDNAIEDLMLSQLSLISDAAEGIDADVNDDLRLISDIFE